MTTRLPQAPDDWPQEMKNYFARFEALTNSIRAGVILPRPHTSLTVERIARINDLHVAIGTCISKQIKLWMTTPKNDVEYQERKGVEAQLQVVIDMLKEEMEATQEVVLSTAKHEEVTYLEAYLRYVATTIEVIRKHTTYCNAQQRILDELHHQYDIYDKYLRLITTRHANATPKGWGV